MRTTLTIDDQIALHLKQIAHRTGKPFQTVVNETLRAGLAAKQEVGPGKRYRIRPASLGAALPGLNLDKALSIADALEDEEAARKMGLLK